MKLTRKKVKPIEATEKTSQIINIKENFAYRFGYETKAEGLKSFKNRTMSAITNVIGDSESNINYYSSLVFRLVAYPYSRTSTYRFANSELKKVLEVIDIEKSKNNFYLWLQILELIANSCSSDDEHKQIWFVSDIAEALKLSGVNAIICDTGSGYKFYPSSVPFLDKKLIIDVLNWMNQYEKAKEQFEQALHITLKGQDDRQVVDCLRLSLELFLKDYLSNNRSLENQYEVLGKNLADKEVSVEIRNMFVKLLDYYSKYNNEHAKHDNSINSVEIDFLMYLTGSFIRFLVKEK